MSWTTILIVGGIVLAATILIAGQTTLTPSVSIDESGVTVTPSNTNTAYGNSMSIGSCFQARRSRREEVLQLRFRPEQLSGVETFLEEFTGTGSIVAAVEAVTSFVKSVEARVTALEAKAKAPTPAPAAAPVSPAAPAAPVSP